jgi:hypothetical protein
MVPRDASEASDASETRAQSPRDASEAWDAQLKQKLILGDASETRAQSNAVPPKRGCEAMVSRDASEARESEARAELTDVYLTVAIVSRNLCDPISSSMARLARNVTADRRDPVDKRIRKDLRVESEARSHFNDASVRNTWTNEPIDLCLESALLRPRGSTLRHPIRYYSQPQPETRLDWNRPTSKTKQY